MPCSVSRFLSSFSNARKIVSGTAVLLTWQFNGVKFANTDGCFDRGFSGRAFRRSIFSLSIRILLAGSLILPTCTRNNSLSTKACSPSSSGHSFEAAIIVRSFTGTALPSLWKTRSFNMDSRIFSTGSLAFPNSSRKTICAIRQHVFSTSG